uniref:DNA-(apurinic or apyrimidinic site) endonuclease n=1 Tax=Macrostomum lignano TaxID=282301 RepID=A0A1I8FN49_9PLAT
SSRRTRTATRARGIYSRDKPLLSVKGIGAAKHDGEGRTECPNGTKTLPPTCAALDAVKPVIVCGDLNVAHLEIDLANPKTNQRSAAGFTKEERDSFSSMLSSLDLVDTFRQVHPDQTKAYTFWSYMRNARAQNIGWRLDYFLVWCPSGGLAGRVCDSLIRSSVMGSDHCPIVAAAEPPASVSAVFWRRSRALLAIGAGCRLAPPSAAPRAVRPAPGARALPRPPAAKAAQQAAEKRQQQQRLPSAQSSLVTREDLEAAWNWQAEGTDPAAATSLILSVDCRAMSSEDLALSLRAIAAPYHARHLGAGDCASGTARRDPRLTLLECAGGARAPPRPRAQLCHLVRDLCVALRSRPARVTAAPLMLLNSAVNDLPLGTLAGDAVAPDAGDRAAPPGPEPALLRRQALVHLRARACLSWRRRRQIARCSSSGASLPGEGELEPRRAFLSAARRGAARASALDPALVGDAALGWRPLLAWSLPPACRHLSECAEGMFELGAEDMDGLLNSQEALLAALTQPVPAGRVRDRGRRAVAAAARDFCELGRARP